MLTTMFFVQSVNGFFTNNLLASLVLLIAVVVLMTVFSKTFESMKGGAFLNGVVSPVLSVANAVISLPLLGFAAYAVFTSALA